MRQRLKWILLALTTALALVALWQVHNIAETVRGEEEENVRLWAKAISQRAHLMEVQQQFFAEATLDERRKMSLYADILQSFDATDLNTDPAFSLAYVHYIVDSAKTPLVIVRAKDSLITVPQDLVGTKLEGALLEEYSQNPPFHYKIWGMPMTLYYKESQYYTRLREMLDDFNRSFLTDITQNTVKVPVVIMDSMRREVYAYGNVDSSHVGDLKFSDAPIEITMPDGSPAYVYYDRSPLVRGLRWLPMLYLFVAFVLVLVSYSLFRTARRDEQNRIWVGLAKETAHQLGTPISSLSGWTEYLRDKELTPQYAAELQKDIRRLETITHRFSKIGSVPELKDESVRSAVENAVGYLRGRLPRKVHIGVSMPVGDPLTAPINGYLFEWVVENLCKNAVDAMDGDGTITIVASQDVRKIYIDISDTGRGMTPAVQRRIFDSGFTTKSRGWGLGLSLAKRIIENYHKGKIFVKSSVIGQGTTFRIILKK